MSLKTTNTMRAFLLLTLTCISFLFVGCKKEDIPSEYANIFNGKDKRAMAPVDLSSKDDFGDFFHSGDFSTLANAVLREYYSDAQVGHAVVLNDARYLKGIEKNGVVYHWPDINFNRYSLLIGEVAANGVLLQEQRIIVSDGAVILYLRFVKNSWTLSYTGESVCFGALYEKVPDGPVEIIKWIDQSEEVNR